MSLQQVLKASKTTEKTRYTSYHVANDSQIFVGTVPDNVIWFFDLNVSTEPFALQGHTHAVWSLAPDGQYLFSGAHDKIVLWDLAQKQAIRSFLYTPATAGALLVWNDSTVISGHFDKMIRIWDRDTATCRRVLSGHGYRNGIKCLSRSQGFLLSAAENIRMWNVDTGECVRIFEMDSTGISKIVVTDRLVTAACHDKMARVWDLETGDLLSMLKKHDAIIGHVQIEGDRIITGAADGSIGVWSTDNFELILYIPPPILEGPRCDPVSGCFRGVVGLDSSNGVLLASGWNGLAKVAQIKDLPRFETLGLPRFLYRTRMRNGKAYVLLTTNGHMCVEIWDLKGSRVESEFTDPNLS